MIVSPSPTKKHTLLRKRFGTNPWFGRHIDTIERELVASEVLNKKGLRRWKLEGDSAAALFSPLFLFFDPLELCASPVLCPHHGIEMTRRTHYFVCR